MIKIVKTRHVGNSTVVTLPADLGFTPGMDVVIERRPNGDLVIAPAARLRDIVQARSRALIEENQEAFAILEEHDRRANHPTA